MFSWAIIERDPCKKVGFWGRGFGLGEVVMGWWALKVLVVELDG